MIKGKTRKEYMKEYGQRPEVKAKHKEHMKEYYQRPEVKAKRREYMQRPEVKAKYREYYQRPEVKAKAKTVKIGNFENIKRICIEHGFSEDVANAIAMDGEVLNKKMRERGILL